MSTSSSIPIEVPELVAVQALPAVLSGTAEAQALLRLPEDFLRAWLKIGNDKVPAIPHFRLGQKVCFPTAAVLEWLATYHGYGGSMRNPALAPKTKRRQPKKGGHGA